MQLLAGRCYLTGVFAAKRALLDSQRLDPEAALRREREMFHQLVADSAALRAWTEPPENRR